MRAGVAAAAAAAAVTAVLLAASGAYACIPLSILKVSPGVALTGETVVVTGAQFRLPAGPGDELVPVVIRWNAPDGPELGRADPLPAGTFTVEVVVPSVPAGSYVIVATQHTSAGVVLYGTPSRAELQVSGRGPANVAAAAESTSTASSTVAWKGAAAGLVVAAAAGTAAARRRQIG